MNRMVKIVLVVGGVLILFAGIAVVGLNSQANNANPASSANNTSSREPTPKDSAGLTIITYTDQGFVPATYTIQVNSNVRIRNRSISILQFVSDPYRTQSDNPELNVGRFNPGDTRTFYVSQMGRWGFHNALNPSQTGTLNIVP
jgi:hypothetical protein